LGLHRLERGAELVPRLRDRDAGRLQDVRVVVKERVALRERPRYERLLAVHRQRVVVQKRGDEVRELILRDPVWRVDALLHWIETAGSGAAGWGWVAVGVALGPHDARRSAARTMNT